MVPRNHVLIIGCDFFDRRFSMETIIIGKQYEKNAELSSFEKKVLCYSSTQEILIYKKNYGISIPPIELLLENDEIFPISLEESYLEPLLQVVNCHFQYKTVNNKLVKQYLKYIREYYTYLVEFNSAFKEKLQPLHIDNEIYIPTIMDIEKAINYVDQIYSTKRSKLMALEALNCKVKGKKYERTN